MPVNRNALIRYTTIDNCLRNRYRKWTLEDLIEACSEALYEFEGIDKGVSRRTVQMDIQIMRSEKLGYNAPVVVIDKKYYTYEDPEYSITNIPLTDQDLGKLTEVVSILKQFKGFTHFRELSGMVQKLEDKIYTSKTHERSIIDLEKNDNLKGLEFIDPTYQAILAKKCLEITYRSFKARQESSFVFHPFLLKEHRNRWFVLGKRKKNTGYMLLALDRIEHLKTSDRTLMECNEEEVASYFDHVIGVTVNEGDQPQEVILLAYHENAPYVLTKPLHHSQKKLKITDEGVYIALFVQLNYELERDILAFGDRIKVISPARLRTTIKERLMNAISQYDTELNERSLENYAARLEARGYIIANHIYSRKSIREMRKLIGNYQDSRSGSGDKAYAIRQLFKEIPELKAYCINSNLKKILGNLGHDLFLTKAIFFDKTPETNWYVIWHQDIPINVVEKTETPGYKSWTQKDGIISVIPPEEILKKGVTIRIHLDNTSVDNGALKIIPGSHKKIHNDEEIKLITESSVATNCEVDEGGIHIMKPLLLHASSKSTQQKRRRVIHLEFNSMELGGALKWSEKEEFNS